MDLNAPLNTLFQELLHLTLDVALFDEEVDKLLLREDVHYRFDLLEPGFHLLWRCALGLGAAPTDGLFVALKET